MHCWSQNGCASQCSARKRLEWELSLSVSDIRSHGWFHGCVTRSAAEHLLHTNGQFLVRFCSARTTDYVLSCRHSGHILHFMINKIVQNKNTVYERIQYTFEDEYFDTIPDLITFYVGNKRPISLASNATITTPVNRLLPLSSDFNNLAISDDSGSGCAVINRFSDSSSDEWLSETPPPKPSRVPKLLDQCLSAQKKEAINAAVVKPINDSLHYVNDTEKTVNVIRSCDTNKDEIGHNLSNESEDSAFFSDSRSAVNDLIDKPLLDDTEAAIASDHKGRPMFSMPPENSVSILKKSQLFHTYLLPKDNKPLESAAIVKIHSVLRDSGARIIANHLVKCDLEFIGHLDDTDFGLGVRSGLELILLPNGEQMRLDVIDRYECLKYFVAITILTASNDTDRTLVLNKWIQIGNETKTALGDLFGFSAIMEALSLPPVVRLSACWSRLRSESTNTAITYETKLRPQLKSMESCTEAQAPNTTFPFVVTALQILQKHAILSRNNADTDDSHHRTPQQQTLNFPFEQTAADFGVEQIYTHLLNARQFIDYLPMYMRNAHILMDDCCYEELLCDMFRTEFHRQFLFGFRGCGVDGEQRFTKLDQIVAVLARKCDSDAAQQHV